MRVDEYLTDDVTLAGIGVRWAIYSAVIGVIGVAATLGIVATTDTGAADFYHSYLVSFMFFLSFGLGALFFVLIAHLTRAGWSVALRRIAEIISLSVLPLAVLAVVVVLGRHELYEWTHGDVVATDALLQSKQGFLNTPFFVARLAFYFIVWSAIAIYFVSRSLKQDAENAPEITLKMERTAAPATIFYALTVTFASFDLLMSLYPHWYSTIYGVYYFSGSLLALLSLMTLMVSAFQGAGKLSRVVTAEHFHDLGKLMFAFVVFWAYIAFSQYMLIWYAHIPEETEWFLVRQEGNWVYLSLFLLVGHFMVPFLWLISRQIKRRKIILSVAAVWLLFMHWFDLFWLVMPEVRPHGVPFRLLDLTCMLAVGGLIFSGVFWRMARVRLIPVGDPRLAESLGFENA